MTIPSDKLDHVRRGRIICSRRSGRPPKCYACRADAKFFCDHPKELRGPMTTKDLEALRESLGEKAYLEVTTCSRPCCAAHAAWWRGQTHLCREHAEQEDVWA